MLCHRSVLMDTSSIWGYGIRRNQARGCLVWSSMGKAITLDGLCVAAIAFAKWRLKTKDGKFLVSGQQIGSRIAVKKSNDFSIGFAL